VAAIHRLDSSFLFICLSGKKAKQRWAYKYMKNLLSIIQDEKASIKLEMSGEDLLDFSNDLINRAKSELSTEIAEARKERYLTKEEVKEICGVCDATLWHWNKKNYLKTIKIGNKVRYRMSDIRRILEGSNKTVTQ
jgi:predicted DNA-binding transcriptional regulator AlpA